MYEKTIFDNDLTLFTSQLDHTQSVTVLVLVGAGSRYENQSNRGISHFLEHMFFKGAKKYQDAAAVSYAVDSVGGEFNAFTGKEYAGYYIKLASHHLDLAIDVLSDMVIESKFDQKEIDKERGVIIEEYNMYQDTPMYQTGWDFEKIMFGDHPLGWDQIGLKEVINSVNHQDFVEYKNKLYTPDNTVIAITGNINDSQLNKNLPKYFNFENTHKDFEFKPLKKLSDTQRIKITNKKTEQTHVVLGMAGYPAEHPDNYAKKILSIMLGGNMSSRMFLNIREAHGLSYYIQTSTDDYLDAGILSTRAGVDNTRVKEAITRIRDEYYKIRDEAEQNKIKEDELTKAKEYLKGKIILSLEDSQELAHLYAKQALLYSKVRDIQEIMKKIDAVNLEDIKRVCLDLIQPKKLKLVLIGPAQDQAIYEKLLG